MTDETPSYGNLLGMGRSALLASNNQEAVEYFNRVLEINPREPEAWIGKGKAVGWQSSLATMRLTEMMAAFRNGIGAASAEHRPAVVAEAVIEINRLTSLLHRMSHDHAVEFASVDKTWLGHIENQASIVQILQEAHGWKPDDRDVLANIIDMSKTLIEGIAYRDRIHQNMPGLRSLTPQYEAIQREQMDAAADKLASLDPGYTKPAIQKKEKEGCFVVTATMGDYDHPTVRLLRDFRDDWLRASPGGTRTVAVYYRIGPSIAAVIGRSTVLRRLSYWLIVRPTAGIARRLLSRGRSALTTPR